MLTPISEEALSDPEAVACYVDQVIRHVVAQGYHNSQQTARAIDNILTDSGLHVLSSFAADIQDSDQERHWACRVTVLAAGRQIPVKALVPHHAVLQVRSEFNVQLPVSKTPPDWYVRLDKIKLLHQLFGDSAFPVKKPRWLLWVIPLSFSCGWLSIDYTRSCYSLLWTSHQESHFSLLRPAIALDFDAVNGIPRSAYRTAITMHQVYDAKEREAIIAEFKTLVDIAYASHCT